MVKEVEKVTRNRNRYQNAALSRQNKVNNFGLVTLKEALIKW